MEIYKCKKSITMVDMIIMIISVLKPNVDWRLGHQ